jgi:nucleoid-associated protein YgaU
VVEDVVRRRRRRRGRRRAAVLFAATACALLCGLVLAVRGGASGGALHVTVHRGDTLWAIAASRYPGDDIQSRVAAIEASNHLASAELSPGQVLTLQAP